MLCVGLCTKWHNKAIFLYGGPREDLFPCQEAAYVPWLMASPPSLKLVTDSSSILILPSSCSQESVSILRTDMIRSGPPGWLKIISPSQGFKISVLNHIFQIPFTTVLGFSIESELLGCTCVNTHTQIHLKESGTGSQDCEDWQIWNLQDMPAGWEPG